LGPKAIVDSNKQQYDDDEDDDVKLVVCFNVCLMDGLLDG